jgi:hypothetical protein
VIRARLLTPAFAFGFCACAGVFQHEQPAEPEQWARTTTAGELRVGSAERDITPPVGCYMAGFSLARVSTRVSAPLKVRALVIESGERRIAILGVDNLGVMREDVDWIKRGLAGFAVGDVFVCSSHTHAGPDLIGFWGFYFMTTGRDRDYVAALRRAAVDAVADARAHAAPARLQRGEAQLPPEGLVKNAKRKDVFDRRVTVLYATALDDGRPLGTLLNLACHPEVMPRTNTALSPDFVGALCERWRARGHGQAVFANGALGAMVSPIGVARDETGVADFSERACDVAEQALRAAAPLAVDAIEVRRRDVYLPIISMGFRFGRLTTTLQRELYDGDARSSVGWLRLGAFEVIAVPGEMEPVLASEIRAALHRPDLVIFGLCDDETGYLLRDRDARDPKFAYERSMSPCRTAGERVRAALVGAP